MALDSSKRPPRAIRLARLGGAFACLGLSVNLFVSWARGSFLDGLALGVFAGFGALFLCCAIICRAEFKEFLKSPRARVMANIFLQAALGLVVVGFLLYLVGFRYHAGRDLTMYRAFELSGETLEILARLKDSDEPIEIYFLKDLDPPDERDRRDVDARRQRVQHLLDEYRTQGERIAKDKLVVEEISYRQFPAEFEPIRKRIDYEVPEGAESILIIKGKQSRMLDSYELFASGASNIDENAPSTFRFQGEKVITSALRGLLLPSQTVYFTTGHGERALQTLAGLHSLLRRQNYDARSLDLAQNERVPKDASFVAVLGPKLAFKPEEVQRLQAYVDGGGRLLVLLDPIFPGGGGAKEPSGLDPLLNAYGLQPRQAYFARSVFVNLAKEETNLAVEGLPSIESPSPLIATLRMQDTRATFWQPCPVEVRAATRPGFFAEPLLLTRNFEAKEGRTWADPTMRAGPKPGPESVKGPFPLAAAAGPVPAQKGQPESRGTRILLVGESFLVTDEMLRSSPGDQIFLLAALRYLAGEDELAVQIPPRDPEERLAKIPEGQGEILLTMLVVGLPALVMFIGIVVWASRRT